MFGYISTSTISEINHCGPNPCRDDREVNEQDIIEEHGEHGEDCVGEAKVRTLGASFFEQFAILTFSCPSLYSSSHFVPKLKEQTLDMFVKCYNM